MPAAKEQGKGKISRGDTPPSLKLRRTGENAERMKLGEGNAFLHRELRLIHENGFYVSCVSFFRNDIEFADEAIAGWRGNSRLDWIRTGAGHERKAIEKILWNPLRGAFGFGFGTGGLRCAPTTGY